MHMFVLQDEKKAICEEEEQDNAMRKRMGLSISLVPEKDEDKKLASLLTFQSPDCKKQQMMMWWIYWSRFNSYKSLLKKTCHLKSENLLMPSFSKLYTFWVSHVIPPRGNWTMFTTTVNDGCSATTNHRESYSLGFFVCFLCYSIWGQTAYEEATDLLSLLVFSIFLHSNSGCCGNPPEQTGPEGQRRRCCQSSERHSKQLPRPQEVRRWRCGCW